jgi:hypothetical protein
MHVKANPVPREEHIDVQDLEHEDNLQSRDKLSFFAEVKEGNDTSILYDGVHLNLKTNQLKRRMTLKRLHMNTVNGRPLRRMMLEVP